MIIKQFIYIYIYNPDQLACTRNTTALESGLFFRRSLYCWKMVQRLLGRRGSIGSVGAARYDISRKRQESQVLHNNRMWNYFHQTDLQERKTNILLFITSASPTLQNAQCLCILQPWSIYSCFCFSLSAARRRLGKEARQPSRASTTSHQLPSLRASHDVTVSSKSIKLSCSNDH